MRNFAKRNPGQQGHKLHWNAPAQRRNDVWVSCISVDRVVQLFYLIKCVYERSVNIVLIVQIQWQQSRNVPYFSFWLAATGPPSEWMIPKIRRLILSRNGWSRYTSTGPQSEWMIPKKRRLVHSRNGWSRIKVN